VGHNVANTQTVLWARILDRLAGPRPPKLIVVDPRTTETAKHASLHLAPRVGTNMALLNGIQHLMFAKGYVDMAWVTKHTLGYTELQQVVREYPPERVYEITGVPVEQLHQAADLIGQAPSLLCTALQGVYQSNQATPSACQVNNIALLRGMIGKPGCGVLQMNGQPTAQNNRESGCNGEYPAFLNHQNPAHMEELARVWNVETHKLPHWSLPNHIMKLLHFMETDTLKLFWVIGTNPAVSLPDLGRIRRLLSKSDVYMVVQDCFMTETTELADLVLPAAIWGEKTGTFTNTDRTVHLSLKAVEPPGTFPRVANLQSHAASQCSLLVTAQAKRNPILISSLNMLTEWVLKTRMVSP